MQLVDISEHHKNEQNNEKLLFPGVAKKDSRQNATIVFNYLCAIDVTLKMAARNYLPRRITLFNCLPIKSSKIRYQNDRTETSHACAKTRNFEPS